MLNAKGPKAEPLYEVMVHIKGGDRKLIEKVRVYWTYRGLYQCPPINPPVESYAFKRLGTGNAERLPRANFVVWAARDGEPGRPVTAPLEIKYFQLSEDRSDFDLSLGKWSCRQ
jgi:hypothetical protein